MNENRGGGCDIDRRSKVLELDSTMVDGGRVGKLAMAGSVMQVIYLNAFVPFCLGGTCVVMVEEGPSKLLPSLSVPAAAKGP